MLRLLLNVAWPAVQFGGYYVNAGNVPRALRWIPSVSLIKHAFEGLCDNEFPGLDFEPVSDDGAGDILKGEQVRMTICPSCSIVLQCCSFPQRRSSNSCCV